MNGKQSHRSEFRSVEKKRGKEMRNILDKAKNKSKKKIKK
jgi:hypothetical protein